MILTMKLTQQHLANIQQISANALNLDGGWNAQNVSNIESQMVAIKLPASGNVTADCTKIIALDSVGALLLIKLRQRLNQQNTQLIFKDLRPPFNKIVDATENQLQQLKQLTTDVNPQNVSEAALTTTPNLVTRIGQLTVLSIAQLIEVLKFIGETAAAFAKSVIQPQRIRWRPILFNIRIAGFDALPIVGLLSFLLGIVVAYQGADQLRQYGANIFVVDLVGLSMLREFAPLMTAIIIAGRSGSAYAAQIGTMAVTEEIDAMQTIGISPQELLVLPKVIALIIAMPLLTVFADLLGVAGGMLMARQQLDVGFVEFLDRFVKAVSPTAFMIGIGKAPVFAAIIAMVGCYQGFRTKGGADSVGRQTTRSVVQAIFLVIVADALFSIAFSMLDL